MALHLIKEITVCDIKTPDWMTKIAIGLIITFVNSNAPLTLQLPRQLLPQQQLLLPSVREHKYIIYFCTHNHPFQYVTSAVMMPWTCLMPMKIMI